MTSYGGYLELELPRGGGPYHCGAAAFNSARSALRHLIGVRKIRKVYVPIYCCGAVQDAVLRSGAECELYRLDEAWEPIVNTQSVRADAAVLYVNYFGLLQNAVERVAERYGQVIIDNSQAFFAPPIAGTDCFYSARKFFGVPDGGYLYLVGESKTKLPYDWEVSWQRSQYLIQRIDESPESGHEGFRANELAIDIADVRRMSKLSQRLMASVDYERVQIARSTNFRALAGHLREIPGVEMAMCSDSANRVPLALPVIIRRPGVREAMIRRRVFVPCYWPEILDKVAMPELEAQLVHYLMPLPIDQRYNEEDMRAIAERLRDALSEVSRS